MTRSEFIAENPILSVLEGRGVKIVGQGASRTAVCPFHADKSPSMSVKVMDGVWHCHACKIGGSVIDLLARFENLSPVEFLKKNEINGDNFHATNGRAAPSAPKVRPVEEKVYQYQDALGRDVYQVVRFKPKTFRQRHRIEDGDWIWNMEGVERVLYCLPEIMKVATVWIVEGEKDADNLWALGICATCNVGGAGKWLDGYTESLAGKDVVLCGDNDKPGQEHVQKVFESIAGKVKTARIVKIPAPHKDASDFIAATGAKAKAELETLFSAAQQFHNGIDLPIFSMADLEPRYRAMVRAGENASLDLSRWLPSFRNVRKLVDGELVLLIGETGTGKTALLQNIAWAAKPMPTLMFEMELPEELMFERFVGISNGMAGRDVEVAYRETEDALGREDLDKIFPHVFVCPKSRMTLEQMEQLIVRSELKIGMKPKLVLVDYVQLIQGTGKRYERTSDAAEGLKVLAKSTKTILVIASQVARQNHENGPELSLYAGKDSGSLENSAGLVIGAWRDENDAKLLHLKVLKNTKGQSGLQIPCNFDGSTMRITERAPASKITPEDFPRRETKNPYPEEA
jgi:5S rRNA maturation endonuclease (ribonuclease M5)/energy-coupling factor transporter ATP-binding protein EcfA2